jgi:hypothetical protein
VADGVYLMNDAIRLREEQKVLFRELAFIRVCLENGEFCALQIGFIE